MQGDDCLFGLSTTRRSAYLHASQRYGEKRRTFKHVLTQAPPIVQVQYMRDYMAHFKLEQHIRFHNAVQNIERAEDYATTGRWRVTAKDLCVTALDELQSTKNCFSKSGKTTTELYDGVFLCTGHHTEPYRVRKQRKQKYTSHNKGEVRWRRAVREPHNTLARVQESYWLRGQDGRHCWYRQLWYGHRRGAQSYLSQGAT